MLVDTYPFFATWSARIGQACRNDAANLYPFRTASPAECRQTMEGIDDGDCYACNAPHDVSLSALVQMGRKADQVFVCWGAIAWGPLWMEHVVEPIRTSVAPSPDLRCRGMTKSGAPRHPLARDQHCNLPDQNPILWRTARALGLRPEGPRS